MILAAGLTPAWQQILSFDNLSLGDVNRASRAEWCASGKVLNVGIALHHLGASVQTLSIIGGQSGNAIREEFVHHQISARWIESQTPTRVCTTLLDAKSGQTTELVENSASITEDDLNQFRRAFRQVAANADWVVLSGSLPAGVPVTLYQELMQDCPGKVILDVRGPELSAALTQKPFLVKPNRAELSKTVGHELPREVDTWNAMQVLNEHGAEWVVITHGPQAVLASNRQQRIRLAPPRVDVVNPIACGDCFAAGLAWGFSEHRDPADCLRLGMAAATENLTQLLPARLQANRVQKIAETICFDVLSG